MCLYRAYGALDTLSNYIYYELLVRVGGCPTNLLMVTFEVLSDYVMVLKEIDFCYCKESATMELFNTKLDREDIEMAMV